MFSLIMENLVKLVVSQTTYTDEEALKMLQQFNGDYMAVLKNFMNDGEKKETTENKIPYHQAKISLLRNALDKANENYARKKEEKERLEQLYMSAEQ